MLIHRIGLEIHNAAGDEDSRFTLSSVLITPDGSLTATDGHQFLRICAAVNEPDLFADEMQGDLPDGLDSAVILPADVAKAFLAASKRKKKKGQKTPQVVVAVQDGKATLATADGKTKRTFVLEPDQATFPTVDRTIPKGTPRCKLALDVDVMLKVLTTLKRCGVDSFEALIYKPDSPIRITARTYIDDSEAIVDGCVMPMRPPAEDKDDAHEPATPEGPMFDEATEAAIPAA